MKAAAPTMVIDVQAEGRAKREVPECLHDGAP